MAAGQEHGCVLYHAEQVGQGLFADDHVQRLFHQRDPVPLAVAEHDVGQFADRPALYPSQGARVEGGDLREGVQE